MCSERPRLQTQRVEAKLLLTLACTWQASFLLGKVHGQITQALVPARLHGKPIFWTEVPMDRSDSSPRHGRGSKASELSRSLRQREKESEESKAIIGVLQDMPLLPPAGVDIGQLKEQYMIRYPGCEKYKGKKNKGQWKERLQRLQGVKVTRIGSQVFAAMETQMLAPNSEKQQEATNVTWESVNRGNEVVTMADKAELVNQIKTLQRTDPGFKQVWWDHCNKHRKGNKDPWRHKIESLDRFLVAYE